MNGGFPPDVFTVAVPLQDVQLAGVELLVRVGPPPTVMVTLLLFTVTVELSQLVCVTCA